MRFREGINFEKRLSPKDDGIITSLMDSLPLFIEAVNLETGYLTNDDNPAILEISRDRKEQSPFVLKPKKGFRVNWALDSFLIRNKEYEIPDIQGYSDERGDLRIHKSFDDNNYTLDIYLISKKD